jgi:hypothetical protein
MEQLRKEFVETFKKAKDKERAGMALNDLILKDEKGSSFWSPTGDLELEKAAGSITLAQLTSGGGKLPEGYQNYFTQLAFEQPGIIQNSRRLSGIQPQYRVPKLSVTDMDWNVASQDVAASDATYNGRAFKDAATYRPNLSFVSLDVFETMLTIKIPKEVLEDNVEQGGMANTVLGMGAQFLNTRMENIIINGDTGSGTSILAQRNGLLLQTTTNVVDAQNAEISPLLLSQVFKSVGPAYMSATGMSYFVHPYIAEDFRFKVASRFTTVGDGVFSSANAVPYGGKSVTGVARMPLDKMLFFNPQNLIVYMRRNVEIEPDYKPDERMYYYHITARWDFKFENELAVAKAINISEVSA